MWNRGDRVDPYKISQGCSHGRTGSPTSILEINGVMRGLFISANIHRHVIKIPWSVTLKTSDSSQ